MITILHIIHSLGLGGAARGMIATAKYSAQQEGYVHRVISLTPADPAALPLAEEAGIEVMNAPGRDTLEREIAGADIVHLSWWNDPEIYDFLRSDLPPMRLMIWPHVAGDGPPQIITQQLVDFSDVLVASSPYTFDRPVLKNLPEQERREKISLVYDAADFARVAGVKPRPHLGYNVGYIGTVDFIKMHPRFVPMSAAVNLPDVRFVVCGNGIENALRFEAQQLGAEHRFDFQGYVTDIRPVLEILDVYGYPLCEGNYASAELNLQEVMVVGIPPVVFPYGGVGRLVVNEFTGLVVESELEYKHALEHLYHHPEERVRLGRNAREYALQIFGAENAARRLNPVYDRMMRIPKRDRLWGGKAGESLLTVTVTANDLTGKSETAAERFIEALGSSGADFRISLTSNDDLALLEAERHIAKASPLLRSEWSGGIAHYRRHHPEDAQLWLWAGLTKLEQGQHEAAFGEFSRAGELGFSHWRLDWYKAQAAHRAGEGQVAEQALFQVHQAAPEFLDACLLLTEIWIERANFSPCLPLLEEALQRYPESSEVLKRLGIARHAIGDIEGAERALESGLRHAPKDLDLLISLGDLRLGTGDAQGALPYFKAATELAVGDVDAWVGLAMAARDLSDRAAFTQALRQIESLDSCHPSLPALLKEPLASQENRHG